MTARALLAAGVRVALDHGACLTSGHNPYLVSPTTILCTRCLRPLK